MNKNCLTINPSKSQAIIIPPLLSQVVSPVVKDASFLTRCAGSVGDLWGICGGSSGGSKQMQPTTGLIFTQSDEFALKHNLCRATKLRVMQRTRVGSRAKVLSDFKRLCCRFFYYYYKITCEQAIVKNSVSFTPKHNSFVNLK